MSFVGPSSSALQDFSVDLCGFASHNWGWHDELLGIRNAALFPLTEPS